MILGFDHLSLTAQDINLEKSNLEKRGFHCIFCTKNVFNFPEKRNLLKNYSLSHDIALFKGSESQLPIEVTVHGNISDTSQGSYIYHNSYIILNTFDIKTEKFFWLNALGFQEKSMNSFFLRSLIPQWSCLIKLVKVNSYEKYYLDSPGYTCVGLLTNSLKEDILKVSQYGASEITNPFKLFLNNKELFIAMFRTPTGAICELIQIK